MRAGQIRRNRLGVVTRHSQFAQTLSGGSNIHQGRSYLLLACYTVTSPWLVLEPENDWEEVGEPSHAERPRALFRRPPVPPPELRPPPMLVRTWLLPWRRPERSPVPDAPSSPPPPLLSPPRRWWWSPPPPFLPLPPEPPPPRVRFPHSRLLLRRCFPRLRSASFSSGVGQTTTSGASSWAIRRALTRARVGAALVYPA